MDCRGFDKKKMLYLYGELSNEERDAVRDHLESCPRCRVELDGLKQTLELLKRAPEAVPSEECLGTIRGLARERKAVGVLHRLRGIFIPQNVFVKRPVLVTAAAAGIILVSCYCLLHFREPVMSLRWEDPFFEQRIAQVEESLEFLTYDTGDEFYELDTFEDNLDRIEEEVNWLVEEIESV
jgi:anti-sigma factor RsiW